MEMQAYFSFLSDLRQALDALTALEQEKIRIVQAGDLEGLDACMKKEQVATLDLRGREQKRTQLLRQLGLEQVPLRELPDHCAPQDRGRATELTQQVLRSYQVLSSAQKAARTLMESHLRRIQKELDGRQRAKETPAPQASQTDFRV